MRAWWFLLSDFGCSLLFSFYFGEIFGGILGCQLLMCKDFVLHAIYVWRWCAVLLYVVCCEVNSCGVDSRALVKI